MPVEQQRIAFIGTGRMAAALATGFCRTLIDPARIAGADPNATARESFRRESGASGLLTADPAAAVADATIVFLSVKPQVMPAVLQELRPVLQPAQLVVSIAAGVTLDTLSAGLPADTRLIRVMPNTPCLIGCGACGVCRGPMATDDDIDTVTALLQTTGVVETVPERLMDAITGLSGSGPAFVFRMIQALSDGGVRVGLPRAVATRLAAQTVAGAAQMVLEHDSHPAVLAEAVTSPGGTTIAGLHALEHGAFTATVMDAVIAATQRSGELGG